MSTIKLTMAGTYVRMVNQMPISSIVRLLILYSKNVLYLVRIHRAVELAEMKPFKNKVL